MDWSNFSILALACASGFLVTSYEGLAQQKGWPVSKILRLDKIGWIAMLGFLCLCGSVILSFFVNPWWSSILVLVSGFIGYIIIASVFKVYTQIFAIILVITSYLLITFFVVDDIGQEGTAENFAKSITNLNEAIYITNTGSPFQEVSPEEFKLAIEKYQSALARARGVDIRKLENRVTGLGYHYENEFIDGIELFLEGANNHDPDKMIMGQVLLVKWVSWYSENVDRIRSGK